MRNGGGGFAICGVELRHGKNAPERKDYLMEDLVVTVEEWVSRFKIQVVEPGEKRIA